MSKKRLIERLKWYYPLEKFHALVSVPAIMIYLIYNNSIQEIIFVLYGLLVCLIILYQGQHYWKMKLHRLQRKKFNEQKELDFFRFSKKANLILIGIMPVFFLIQMYFQNWRLQSNAMLFWGILANFFAFLEYYNYYHHQLMVDNQYDLNYLIRNKRLKKASLAKDLIDNKL